MQQLNNLVLKLNTALKEKREELTTADSFNSYSESALQNLQLHIDDFEGYVKGVDSLAKLQDEATLIKNFTDEYHLILADIQKLEMFQ